MSERWGDLPIAIDQFGRSQEYTLRYAVVFAFKRADGTDLVPQQVVELSRDYVSQPDNATGNFVKIAQRLGVRIAIDADQPLAADLSPGMSVVVHVDKSMAPEGAETAAR